MIQQDMDLLVEAVQLNPTNTTSFTTNERRKSIRMLTRFCNMTGVLQCYDKQIIWGILIGIRITIFCFNDSWWLWELQEQINALKSDILGYNVKQKFNNLAYTVEMSFSRLSSRAINKLKRLLIDWDWDFL